MRSLSVQRHAEWRIKLAQSQAAVADPIDDDHDDLLQVDPYSGDCPSRRSDKELARVLLILDSLDDERGSE